MREKDVFFFFFWKGEKEKLKLTFFFSFIFFRKTNKSKQRQLRDGDTTPYGTLVRDCQARACWEECLRSSDFAARQLEVEAFNRSSR